MKPKRLPKEVRALEAFMIAQLELQIDGLAHLYKTYLSKEDRNEFLDKVEGATNSWITHRLRNNKLLRK